MLIRLHKNLQEIPTCTWQVIIKMKWGKQGLKGMNRIHYRLLVDTTGISSAVKVGNFNFCILLFIGINWCNNNCQHNLMKVNLVE
jgi:hypothetical protein